MEPPDVIGPDLRVLAEQIVAREKTMLNNAVVAGSRSARLTIELSYGNRID
ncbi:MAG: hypothetical protein M3Z23_03525 [Acidobacteriota bacterium]|nr:hypothetical protein [Acidobacteriota bacterium]